MMNFRVVNKAIIDLLGAAAAGRYKTVGFESQGKAASEIKGNGRQVQSYYAGGDFAKTAGRLTGPTQHAMTFTIGLSVSAPARLNLNLINSVNSTAPQIAAALAALQEAAYCADLLFDELVEIVYQVVMHGPNYDLGLPVGTISNRWVDSIRKDPPAPNGELVVLTGTLQLSLQTCEDVTGDSGVLADTSMQVVNIDLSI